MAGAADHLPDDTDALKTALIEARAKLSGARALIEHLQLVIAKMQREKFGPRSEPQPAAHRSTGIAARGIGGGCRRGGGEGRDEARRGAGLHAASGDAA